MVRNAQLGIQICFDIFCDLLDYCSEFHVQMVTEEIYNPLVWRSVAIIMMQICISHKIIDPRNFENLRLQWNIIADRIPFVYDVNQFDIAIINIKNLLEYKLIGKNYNAKCTKGNT